MIIKDNCYGLAYDVAKGKYYLGICPLNSNDDVVELTYYGEYALKEKLYGCGLSDAQINELINKALNYAY